MFDSRLSRRDFISVSGVSILGLYPLRTAVAADTVEVVTNGGLLHIAANGRPVLPSRLRQPTGAGFFLFLTRRR